MVYAKDLPYKGENIAPKSRETSAQEVMKKIAQDEDAYYDPNVDYARFSGRISDRDDGHNIFKVQSENSNIRFFRAGDYIKFTIPNISKESCEAYIRSVETGYFVMYVTSVYPCFSEGEYFRRGTILHIFSERLVERIHDASNYRILLLKRREDFFRQLNHVNHFVWSYDQEKIKLAAEYDQQMIELQKKKQKALENLVEKKKDSQILQKELAQRLDLMDNDLEFYRIGKNELFVDRWNSDKDSSAPVQNFPEQYKASDNKPTF
jgi:hypothetical protein